MAYRNRTIPDDDWGIRRFVYNFSRGIAKDPELYGFDEQDAAFLIEQADELIVKSMLATRPATRTTAAVQGKNQTRKRVLEIFRGYVGEVKANTSIDNSLLLTDVTQEHEMTWARSRAIRSACSTSRPMQGTRPRSSRRG